MQIQPVRVLPTGETELAGHQVQLAAAANEYLLRPQAVHVPVPVAVLYVPALQGVHAVPSAPVYPARHLQFVSSVLLAAEEVKAGHAAHVVDTIAEIAVE
jgi:hypothetical protein